MFLSGKMFLDKRRFAVIHSEYKVGSAAYKCILIGRWDRERSQLRRRRGTQKLSGKRTGSGRYSEKAGRQRPTTEGATSHREGISQVTQRGHKAVMSGFVSFFAAKKNDP